MLFRNFIFVTLFACTVGIAVSQATGYQGRSEQTRLLDQRLKQWHIFDLERACRANPKHCRIDPIITGDVSRA